MRVSVLGGLAFFCYRVGPVENLGPGMRPGRGLEPVRPRRYMFMRPKIIFVQHEDNFRLWIRGYAKSAAWCTYLDGAQGRSGRGSVRPDRGKDLRAAHPILRSTALFLALLKGMDDAVKLNQKRCPRIQIQPHDSGYLGLHLGVVHP